MTTESQKVFQERRVVQAGFNGCLKKARGEYCQPCVAKATGYTYTGEKDRRLKPCSYHPHTPDINFEDWYNNNCTVNLDMSSAILGWKGHKKHILAKLQSEEVVEKVAIQLSKLQNSDDVVWDDMHKEKYQEKFLTVAKAAIAAVLEHV